MTANTVTRRRSTFDTLKVLLSGPIALVWLGLILGALTSWHFGSDHGSRNHTLVTTLVMVIAFIKVRLVGLYFMELRDAPTLLRAIFEGYCVVLCAVLLGIYYAS